ncbi:MAG: hypothetical protein JJ895_07440 [Balneolaceae bacterium]|nr:hypothetical protein [Balneolaceae bacterium]
MYFKLQILLALIKLRLAKWWYKNKLDKLREKRWKSLQKQLLHSPFYQKLVLNKTPLDDYPIMDKSAFMASFDKINTVGIKLSEALKVAEKAEQQRDFSPTLNGITIGLSSGTSGNRGIFMASQAERANWVACILDRVIGISFKKRSVAFFLRANSNLYSSVSSRLLKFSFFDILQPMDQHIEALNALQPSILVAQPSVLLEIAACIEEGKVSISPAKIISVAEVLTPEDARNLEGVFNQTIHQVYQCTEGLLATTCEHGKLHFNDDFLIIEKKYLDEEKKRYHPIITDLLRTSQPIIRYELNDIIHEKNDCPCRSTFTAIEMIEGRSDDVLVFRSNENKSVKIYPDFIRREIILTHPSIQDYTVIQKSESIIELYVGKSQFFDKVKQRLQSFLRSQGIDTVEIRQSLSRNHRQGKKLRRVQNESQKN